MYISKREEKRRQQKLWHMSAEEQMKEYYLQQEKRVLTSNTTTIERNAFEIGKGKRMQKKVHNTFSKEEFGTCGTYIATKRFANSRLTCVCKSRNLY